MLGEDVFVSSSTKADADHGFTKGVNRERFNGVLGPSAAVSSQATMIVVINPLLSKSENCAPPQR